MVGTTDIDSKNAVFRLEGDRNVKVVFAGGQVAKLSSSDKPIQ